MIQVAIAASTINANRIVYAEGSENRLFFSGSPAATTTTSLIEGLPGADVARFYSARCVPSSGSRGDAAGRTRGFARRVRRRAYHQAPEPSGTWRERTERSSPWE